MKWKVLFGRSLHGFGLLFVVVVIITIVWLFLYIKVKEVKVKEMPLAVDTDNLIVAGPEGIEGKGCFLMSSRPLPAFKLQHTLSFDVNILLCETEGCVE